MKKKKKKILKIINLSSISFINNSRFLFTTKICVVYIIAN